MRWKFVAAVLVGVPFLTLAVPPAGATEPIAPASLIPALTVYVDALVRGHAAAAVCAGPDSKARDEGQWTAARTTLVATLWANGFPTDFVHDITAKFTMPGPAPSDCNDPELLTDFYAATQSGWLEEVHDAIHGMGLTLVDHPVSDTQWQEIRNTIAADLPRQARLLACVAASAPGLLPITVHEWDAMILDIGGKLVAAGLPRDEIASALAAAEANVLWHPAAPAEAANLRTSCAADKTWSERLYTLAETTLGYAVDKLLPPPATDDSTNN